MIVFQELNNFGILHNQLSYLIYYLTVLPIPSIKYIEGSENINTLLMLRSYIGFHINRNLDHKEYKLIQSYLYIIYNY